MVMMIIGLQPAGSRSDIDVAVDPGTSYGTIVVTSLSAIGLVWYIVCENKNETLSRASEEPLVIRTSPLPRSEAENDGKKSQKFPMSGSLHSGLQEQEADAGSAEIPPRGKDFGCTTFGIQFLGRHR
ncbi:hypothetical protein B0I37DRAFT_356714 [Chaetomium sp. MPI-CAGE-AT-0009]|nr:hypothetical protein B0I37DRAFT_356714 [Chaetomium sp. MPI-CAGE-AT-0009]